MLSEQELLAKGIVIVSCSAKHLGFVRITNIPGIYYTTCGGCNKIIYILFCYICKMHIATAEDSNLVDMNNRKWKCKLCGNFALIPPNIYSQKIQYFNLDKISSVPESVQTKRIYTVFDLVNTPFLRNCLRIILLVIIPLVLISLYKFIREVLF